MKQIIPRLAHVFLGCLCLMVAAGCRKEHRDAQGLRPVVLQTDWFAQPEHGGFYQALARGYYADAGLDVTILEGGPNAMSVQKVLTGRSQFAMNRADTIRRLHEQAVPVVMVMATLQHDPQALMMHAGNPVASFAELDGRRIMAVPGLAWIQWIEAKYDISLEIIPHDFGMERFIHDTDLIQQCLLTNEPFYVERAGVTPKVLPLRESGFNPYHGIYCLQELIDSDPDLVAAFVAASVRGWRDFILNDPAPAFALIAERNEKMTPDFMAFSYRMLKEEGLVTGEGAPNEDIGWLDESRMDDLVAEMKRLGLIDANGAPEPEWYTTRFLLRPGDGQHGVHP